MIHFTSKILTSRPIEDCPGSVWNPCNNMGNKVGSGYQFQQSYHRERFSIGLGLERTNPLIDITVLLAIEVKKGTSLS